MGRFAKPYSAAAVPYTLQPDVDRTLLETADVVRCSGVWEGESFRIDGVDPSAHRLPAFYEPDVSGAVWITDDEAMNIVRMIPAVPGQQLREVGFWQRSWDSPECIVVVSLWAMTPEWSDFSSSVPPGQMVIFTTLHAED